MALRVAAIVLGACVLAVSPLASTSDLAGTPPVGVRGFEVALPAAVLAVTAAAATTDGGVVVAGIADLAGMRSVPGIQRLTCPDGVAAGPCTHAFVIAVDRNGLTRNVLAIGGDGVERHVAVAFAADGSLWALVTGSSTWLVASSERADSQAGPCSGHQSILMQFGPRLDGIRQSMCVGGPGATLEAHDLAVGRDGAVWVAGSDCDGSSEAVGAWQPAANGGCDIYVARFAPGQSRATVATYLGGSRLDYPTAIATTRDGDVLIAGATLSRDFPTVRALQRHHGRASDPDAFDHDAVLVRMDASGRWLEYSTFLGGSAQDAAEAVTSDAEGNAFVAGSTASADFLADATSGSESTRASGDDVFVVSVGPDGALRHAQTLGGDGFDDARAVFLQAHRSLWVFGRTSSSDFPADAPQRGEGEGAIWETPFVARADATESSGWRSAVLAPPAGGRPASGETRFSNHLDVVASDGVGAFVAGSATEWMRHGEDWVPVATTRYLRKVMP